MQEKKCRKHTPTAHFLRYVCPNSLPRAAQQPNSARKKFWIVAPNCLPSFGRHIDHVTTSCSLLDKQAFAEGMSAHARDSSSRALKEQLLFLLAFKLKLKPLLLNLLALQLTPSRFARSCCCASLLELFDLPTLTLQLSKLCDSRFGLPLHSTAAASSPHFSPYMSACVMAVLACLMCRCCLIHPLVSLHVSPLVSRARRAKRKTCVSVQVSCYLRSMLV